jgi:glycerophosphoryl diester phosphodiesterase
MQEQDRNKSFFYDNNVVAYRGAWSDKIPQNSIESLKNAIRLECAGSLSEMQMTADGEIVLFADDEYRGKKVEKHTYGELSSDRLPNGEPLPVLRKALMEILKQTGTRLFLDVKPMSSKKMTLRCVEKAVELIKQYAAQRWIVFVSADADAITRINELLPSSPTVWISDNKKNEDKMNISVGKNFIYKVTDRPEVLLKET